MSAPDPSNPNGGNAARRVLQRLTGPQRQRQPRSARTGTPYGPGRDPLPLAFAVPALMADQGWEQVQASATITQRWAQIVGPDLAANVEPESLVDAVLTLRATSTAWATQVRLLVPHLHRTIDEAVGPGVVVQIHVNGPQAPSWVRGPRRVKGRGPRDTYG